MNKIEQLNQSTYSTRAEWLEDVDTPEYAQHERFREAVEAKFARSFDAIRANDAPSGILRRRVETRVQVTPEDVEQPIDKPWDERGVAHEAIGGVRRITLKGF